MLRTSTATLANRPHGYRSSASMPQYSNAPGAPDTLAVVPGPGYADFSWNAPSSGADTYELWSSPTSGSGYTATHTGITGTTYHHIASAFVTLYWVCYAVKGGIRGPASNEVSNFDA